MILHPDGRVEGTPEEVVAYKREMQPVVTLTEQQYPPMERKGTNDARQTLAAGGKVQLVEAKPEREVQYTAAKMAETQRQTELTEEQVSSLSTHRLVEELSNRTGVDHIPVNEDDVLKLQIANQSKLSVKQREDLFGSKYILIERG